MSIILNFENLIITLKISLDTLYKTNFFNFSSVMEREKHILKKGTEILALRQGGRGDFALRWEIIKKGSWYFQ